MDLKELYRDVILDHNKKPRNFGKLEAADAHADGHNPLCGDRLSVFIKMNGDRVEDLRFEGKGCAISTASASLMTEAVNVLRQRPKAELLWASPRELLNVFQADAIGCHIITATKDILGKLSLVGKDLDDYSLETVEMFRRDAVAAGFEIGGAVEDSSVRAVA